MCGNFGRQGLIYYSNSQSPDVGSIYGSINEHCRRIALECLGPSEEALRRTLPLGYSPFIEWHRPMVSYWKLNIDVAWNIVSRLGGLGLVLGDHLGRVCIVGSKFIHKGYEVKVLEPMTICLGLEKISTTLNQIS